MTSPRQGNDRGRRLGAARARAWTPAAKDGRRHRDPAPETWLWGWHAVAAALANPARLTLERLVATPQRASAVAGLLASRIPLETLDADAIARLLPAGAVHQGLALRAPPPAPAALDALAQPAEGFLVMLDQVTDPQNVGAVFRDAAAFGARGMILQDRHAPPLSGAVAKASAGAIDAIPHAREVNLSRALERLDSLGWRAVGLEASAADELSSCLDGRPTVLVLGSEGEGLRRLVAEHCDVLARIPLPGGFDSLNVAAAAAIACYEASRAR